MIVVAVIILLQAEDKVLYKSYIAHIYKCGTQEAHLQAHLTGHEVNQAGKARATSNDKSFKKGEHAAER